MPPQPEAICSADLPTWLAGIGTVVAAIAAMIALIAAFKAGGYTRRLLDIESEREERALRESEGRQAYLIDAWEERLPRQTLGGIGQLVVRLVNGSQVAVYDVHIDWFDHSISRWRAGIGVPILKPGLEDIPVPSELSHPEVSGVQELSTEPISGWPFQVKFRDRAGLLWRRDFTGRIEKISEEEFLSTP